MSELVECFELAFSITGKNGFTAAMLSSWLEQNTTRAQQPSACTASFSGCAFIASSTAWMPPCSRTKVRFGSQWKTTLRSAWQPSSWTDALSRFRAIAATIVWIAPTSPAVSLHIGWLNVAWESLANPSEVTSGDVLSIIASASFTGSGRTNAGTPSPSMRVVVWSGMARELLVEKDELLESSVFKLKRPVHSHARHTEAAEERMAESRVSPGRDRSARQRTITSTTMGNKQGKPRASATPPPAPAPAKAKPSDEAPPPAPQPKASPPPALVQPTMHPLLESKLSMVDITTIFTPQDIDAIRSHLASLLGQREDEPIVIPKDEFYRFLGISTSSLYVNRLYAIFDMAGKGTIDFDDLIRGLSVLSQKATREQKLLLSFHLLDADGKGYITKQTTTELLRSCLAECKEVDIHLSDEQIARIVDNTFEEADLDNNDVVDLLEYQALDAKHPGLFDFLTVDALGVFNHLEKVQSMITTSTD